MKDIACLYSGSVDFCRSFGPIEGLSTREGKVLLLRDIIDDLSEALLESMQHPNRKYSTEGVSLSQITKSRQELNMNIHIVFMFYATKV